MRTSPLRPGDRTDISVPISRLAGYKSAHALPRPTCDPLREKDALLDAQRVAMWLSVATSTTTLVFDLRQADIGEVGNTGGLVVHGMRSLSWDGEPWLPGWLAWSVGASAPRWRDGLLTVEIEFEHLSPSSRWPRCLVVGRAAEYYVCDVPGLPDAPPDFGADSEDTIRRGMAGWDPTFLPQCMSSMP